MRSRRTPPFRADHVGSLIRSSRLLEARAKHAEGKLPLDDLRTIEDDEIASAVAMQQRVGLRAITDGELRRGSWRDDFFENVDGFTQQRFKSPFTFTEASGARQESRPIPHVESRLRRRRSMVAEYFGFLKKLARAAPKVTMPSPTVNHLYLGDHGFPASVYPNRQAYLQDIADIYRQEFADLAALGCSYVQLDDVPLAVLCDPRNRDIIRRRGEDPDELVENYVGLINTAIAGRPKDMTVCVHLCRGNHGQGMASGGYEPIAERVFQQLDVTGFFLEYDTERAGGFEPLRFLGSNKVAVLGLISTKDSALEDVDTIKRRIDEATKFVPLERLCISPQCGFASSSRIIGRFTPDDQERKLAHVVRIAGEVWPNA